MNLSSIRVPDLQQSGSLVAFGQVLSKFNPDIFDVDFICGLTVSVYDASDPDGGMYYDFDYDGRCICRPRLGATEDVRSTSWQEAVSGILVLARRSLGADGVC